MPYRPGPVSGQLDARGFPDVVGVHPGQYVEWLSSEDGVAVAHELGPGHPRQDALDQRAVSPGGVRSIQDRQPSGIDVDAAELQARAGSLIQVAVKCREHGFPSRIDRSVDERYEVKVTDALHVVTGCQRAAHKKIRNPSEPREPTAQLLNGRR